MYMCHWLKYRPAIQHNIDCDRGVGHIDEHRWWHKGPQCNLNSSLCAIEHAIGNYYLCRKEMTMLKRLLIRASA